MSALDSKAAEILGQLQHLAPQATQLAMEAARIEAISSITQDGAGVLLGLMAATLVWKRWWPWVTSEKFDEDEMDIPVAIATFIVAVLCIITGLICFFAFLDPWHWVSLWHPEFWLAHVATAKLGGS